MNLYLLTQSKCRGYDTYDSCVVAAESEDKAVLMHPDGGLITNRNYYSAVWPKDSSHVEATLIGKAIKGTTAQVILASFNAG